MEQTRDAGSTVSAVDHTNCAEAARRYEHEIDKMKDAINALYRDRAELELVLEAMKDLAASRHYVCEAHVPLGEPGNYDDVCPCCVAMDKI